ncbi:unnamed protein product [Litomosoides sigmodontis]|uniref:Chitin-binding type-2 domain-containing protein n=1 Tax=Litomosoides sigmodontis TaxID=42156 RepID=A0A3P6T3W0_LITSI|nr:unnamed protein product [Litomosoides sigmodontis]
MILAALLIISLQINLIENASGMAELLRELAVPDCSRRNSNGLYARGCSSKFMRCYNGKLYVYRCGDGLKFNVETAKCEKAKRIIACLNNISLDCSNRKDGIYGSGKCSTTYYRCFRGQSSEMSCPADLYYNDKLKGCDKVDRIEECNVLIALQGFNERRASYLGKYMGRNLLSNFNETKRYIGGAYGLSFGKENVDNGHDDNDKKRLIRQTVKSSIAKSAAESNCITQERDVAEHSACSKFYYNCTNGKSIQLQCPEGQVYDARQRQCNVAEFVPECANTKSSTSPATDIQIADIILAPELNAFCNATGDGLFSAGCKNYFYFCASGYGYHVKCPEGLFFDNETRACNYKERVTLCNLASDHLRQVTIANEQPHTYATTAKSVDQGDGNEWAKNYNVQMKKVIHGNANHIPEASLPALLLRLSKYEQNLPLHKDFNCRSKANGFYSIGCKTEFVACANQRMFFFECPRSLIFNEEAQICDHAENVADCLKTEDANGKESFLTTIPEMEREISSAKKTETVHGVTTIQDQNFCKNLNDGVYFNDCKNEYIVCSGQTAFPYNCREGQIIDPVSKTCNEEENVPQCASKKYHV